MLEERLSAIEQDLELIKQRNARVEADKSWETSKTRIGTICAITYVIALLLLFALRTERFWLNALLPAIGFYLSAQSLPAIKRWWIASLYQKQ